MAHFRPLSWLNLPEQTVDTFSERLFPSFFKSSYFNYEKKLRILLWGKKIEEQLLGTKQCFVVEGR